MKKLLISVLALALIFTLAPQAAAVFTEPETAADKLHTLGLFNGVGDNADGTPNYDLDRAPTRAEAVTLLVRLLGREAEAKAGAWTTPFTDVDEWALPYVGYAYANKLTNGISETLFGGAGQVTATQYITFVLRALGYTSGVDFAWDSAWTLSDAKGFTDGRFNAETAAFTRGDAAAVSFDALSATDMNTGKALFETLLDKSAITAEAVKSVGLIKDSITVSIPKLPQTIIGGGKNVRWGVDKVNPADFDQTISITAMSYTQTYDADKNKVALTFSFSGSLLTPTGSALSSATLLFDIGYLKGTTFVEEMTFSIVLPLTGAERSFENITKEIPASFTPGTDYIIRFPGVDGEWIS